MKWVLAPAIALVFVLLPSLAFAAEGEAEDILIRVGADLIVPADQTVGSVVVIDGNAVIQGTVRDNVVVISGNAVVSGSIGANLTVIAGDIELRSGANVVNVTSIRGDLRRADGAVVTGETTERDNVRFFEGITAVFSILVWVAMTIAIIAAGLIFAAVGGRQLTRSATAITADPVNTIIGLVFVWVAIPMIAGVAIVTLVGGAFGIGLLVFLLPALWFLGYIVAATRLGGFLTGLAGASEGAHPYAAAAVGLLCLQVLILVPVLGALAAFLAGIVGAGGLAVTAFRAAGGKGFQPSATSGPAPTEHAT